MVTSAKLGSLSACTLYLSRLASRAPLHLPLFMSESLNDEALNEYDTIWERSHGEEIHKVDIMLTSTYYFDVMQLYAEY